MIRTFCGGFADNFIGCFFLFVIPLLVIWIGKWAISPGEFAVIKTAENAGFHNVSVDERWLLLPEARYCRDEDWAAYDLNALNLANKSVRFTVCCGTFLAGCRLRDGVK